MIEIENVSKTFKKKLAVDHLSLSLKDGEVFGLLGPNGAGKSTLLKMMTGILACDTGDIFLSGRSITKEPVLAKSTFGFVPDSPDLFLGLPGKDYLAFMAGLYPGDLEEKKKTAFNLAKEFHIDSVLDEPIFSYSHGMRQKILIIGALLHHPDNWILDEPMTGLDPEASFEVKSMMKEEAKKGHCILFSTHVLEVAEKVCDRVGIIQNGKLLFAGTMAELRGKENQGGDLEDLFLELTKE